MLNPSRFLSHVNVTRSDNYGDHWWMVNLSVEEPDALMCARPDLWKPWVGNDPGPTGHSIANLVISTSSLLIYGALVATKILRTALARVNSL